MRQLCCFALVAALAMFACARRAQADVVNFDDVTLTQSLGSVANAWADLPTNYAGYQWTGWEVMSDAACAANYSGCTIAAPSAPNFAYGGNDTATLTTESGTPFIFSGVDLAYWPGAEGALSTVTIQGYMNNVLVGSTTTTLANSFQNSGGIAGPIDKLVFPVAGVYRADNFNVAPVPEPSSIALLGTGLLAAGLVIRRRQWQQKG